jgi:type IV pilus assembly protein PilX
MKRIPTGPARQRGAALYIALIMLVLLALIGVIGMQVAGMQERMSSDYRLTNIAFQRAEDLARAKEQEIGATLVAGTVFAADVATCAGGDSPATWANAVTTAQDDQTRRLDTCFPGGSSKKIGLKQNEQTANVYEITAFSKDDLSGTSEAVIDTVYIP